MLLGGKEPSSYRLPATSLRTINRCRDLEMLEPMMRAGLRHKRRRIDVAAVERKEVPKSHPLTGIFPPCCADDVDQLDDRYGGVHGGEHNLEALTHTVRQLRIIVAVLLAKRQDRCTSGFLDQRHQTF